jgi:hypothetical protein
MNLYKKLYFQLFAMIANAVESLESNEPNAARKTLIAAMRETEDLVIAAEGE